MNSDILITEYAFNSPECILNIIDTPLVFNCSINLQLVSNLYFNSKYIFLSLTRLFVDILKK